MPEALIKYFESLHTEADLQRLVDDGREEDLHLEFKTKHRRDTSDLDDKERDGFSKCLSGFANADGGILIFGIQTDRSATGTDRACALKPITDAETFRARLMSSVLQATQPPVDGVRIEVILSEQCDGYVKCLVPPSDKPPHRAMLSGREYWSRGAAGFRKLEHFELEDAFGRRQRPALRMRIDLRGPSLMRSSHVLEFAFLNEGRGVARHSGFHCMINTRVNYLIPINGGVRADGQQSVIQYYDPHSVVHPNGIYSGLGTVVVDRGSWVDPLELNVTWYAESMTTRSALICLSPDGAGVFL